MMKQSCAERLRAVKEGEKRFLKKVHCTDVVDLEYHQGADDGLEFGSKQR